MIFPLSYLSVEEYGEQIQIKLQCQIHGSLFYIFYPKLHKEITLSEFVGRVVNLHIHENKS